jgi:thiol:disulfide interchange protein DsbA
MPNSTFVAAAFRADEDWPMFQRAYYTAQLMDIDKQDPRRGVRCGMENRRAGGVRRRAPSGSRCRAPGIEDAARFYARVAGVKPETFVSQREFLRRRRQDPPGRSATSGAAQVDETPTVLVNGKYRVTLGAAGGDDQLIELVKYLVAQESASHPGPKAH